jgi:hypothetical protein
MKSCRGEPRAPTHRFAGDAGPRPNALEQLRFHPVPPCRDGRVLLTSGLILSSQDV